MPLLVDDRDTSISWNGTWTLKGRLEEYKSTTHGTRESGASFTFRFTGTSVFVYGTNPKQTQNQTVACKVDNEAYIQYLLPYTPFNQYRMSVCAFPSLKPADHVLVLHVGFPKDGGLFYIDFLAYDDGISNVSSTLLLPSSSTPAKQSSSTTSASIAQSVLPSGTPQSCHLVPEITRKNGDVLVIGIIFATYLLLSIILACILYRRYRQQASTPTRSPTLKLLSCVIGPSISDEPHPHGEIGFALDPPPPSSSRSRHRGVSSTPSGRGTLSESAGTTQSRGWRRTFVTLHIGRQTLRRKLGI